MIYDYFSCICWAFSLASIQWEIFARFTCWAGAGQQVHVTRIHPAEVTWQSAGIQHHLWVWPVSMRFVHVCRSEVTIVSEWICTVSCNMICYEHVEFLIRSHHAPFFDQPWRSLKLFRVVPGDGLEFPGNRPAEAKATCRALDRAERLSKDCLKCPGFQFPARFDGTPESSEANGPYAHGI